MAESFLSFLCVMIISVAVKQADPDFLKALGERLASLRKSKGITQTELGEAIGVKQYVIASYETGRNQMPISLLQPISSTLDVSISELLGEAEVTRKRGPIPKLVKRMEQVNQLPKSSQKKILDVVEDMIVAAQAKAS